MNSCGQRGKEGSAEGPGQREMLGSAVTTESSTASCCLSGQGGPEESRSHYIKGFAQVLDLMAHVRCCGFLMNTKNSRRLKEEKVPSCTLHS